jgi:5-enolpyruvylshikimate-3-phosphate synthase
MAFSALAFTGKVIVIDDATCVRKSYPAFWGQLADLQLSVY